MMINFKILLNQLKIKDHLKIIYKIYSHIMMRNHGKR